MVRRLVALLLIFPVLANAVPALPHSHAGTGVAEAEDHASRPHVHLHGHGHHHHHGSADHHHHDNAPADEKQEESPVSSWRSAIDHDGDALYLPDSVSVGVSRKSNQAEAVFQAIVAVAVSNAVIDEDSRLPLGFAAHPPPGSGFQEPQLMRNPALRI